MEREGTVRVEVRASCLGGGWRELQWAWRDRKVCGAEREPYYNVRARDPETGTPTRWILRENTSPRLHSISRDHSRIDVSQSYSSPPQTVLPQSILAGTGVGICQSIFRLCA